jgi:hypothetical protein
MTFLFTVRFSSSKFADTSGPGPAIEASVDRGQITPSHFPEWERWVVIRLSEQVKPNRAGLAQAWALGMICPNLFRLGMAGNAFMATVNRTASLGIWAGLLLFAAGCGKQESSTLTQVSGKVSYRGAPLSSGTIVFIPDAARGSSGPPVWAEIGHDGGYQLKTGNRVGISAGRYRVTVAAVEKAPSVVPGSVPRSLVPDKYRDPEMSGLACEVEPGKDNAIHFNLE